MRHCFTDLSDISFNRYINTCCILITYIISPKHQLCFKKVTCFILQENIIFNNSFPSTNYTYTQTSKYTQNSSTVEHLWTYVLTHQHAFIHSRAPLNVCTYSHTRFHTQSSTSKRMYLLIHTLSYTVEHLWTYVLTHSHAFIHSRAPLNVCTYSLTPFHTHA